MFTLCRRESESERKEAAEAEEPREGPVRSRIIFTESVKAS